MNEEKSIIKIREAFDLHIKKTNKIIADQSDVNEKITKSLAFYMFEHKLVKGELHDVIKKAYDTNNLNSDRLAFIMELKDKNLPLEELPVEIKLIIKEMVL